MGENLRQRTQDAQPLARTTASSPSIETVGREPRGAVARSQTSKGNPKHRGPCCCEDPAVGPDARRPTTFAELIGEKRGGVGVLRRTDSSKCGQRTADGPEQAIARERHPTERDAPRDGGEVYELRCSRNARGIQLIPSDAHAHGGTREHHRDRCCRVSSSCASTSEIYELGSGALSPGRSLAPPISPGARLARTRAPSR